MRRLHASVLLGALTLTITLAGCGSAKRTTSFRHPTSITSSSSSTAPTFTPVSRASIELCLERDGYEVSRDGVTSRLGKGPIHSEEETNLLRQEIDLMTEGQNFSVFAEGASGLGEVSVYVYTTREHAKKAAGEALGVYEKHPHQLLAEPEWRSNVAWAAWRDTALADENVVLCVEEGEA